MPTGKGEGGRRVYDGERPLLTKGGAQSVTLNGVKGQSEALSLSGPF